MSADTTTASRRIAVMDVGGTYIKHCLVEGGAIREMGKVPTPQDTQEHFLEAVEGVLAQMGGAPALAGLALSMPGVIDVERRYMYAGGSLKYNNRRFTTS